MARSRIVRPLLIAVLMACLGAPAARGAVEWKNGPRPEPRRMASDELAREFDRLARRPAERRVVIHFDGPITNERRALLANRGVRLLGYLGAHAYFATLTRDLVARGATTIPGIVSVEAIDTANKLHPDLAAGRVLPWAVVPAEQPGAGPTASNVAVVVTFHPDVDLEGEARAVIARSGGKVVSTIRSIRALVVHLPAYGMADLAAEDAVMYVEPPLPPLTELNVDNAVRTGAASASQAPYEMTGSGVTVLVYDGGRALAHGDLAGRHVVGQSDTAALSDHATHVSCTVAGDGAGGSQYRGMAPEASIVSYGFQSSGGGFLYTNPGDLEDDYTEAIELYGADLSNNSIGTNVSTNGLPCEWEGDYSATGALIDEVVRGSLGAPFRIVWAGGNERQSTACGGPYYTSAPPACNKNALVVGALNANDDSMTSFSSWGPCDDGRLRPEVAAPGCQSGGDGGVSSCSSSGGYNVKCGTSMASPTVAGLSALLLEKYRALYPSEPDFRNSLLRAIFVHTAVDLGNPGPDYQTGYGSVRVLAAADVLSTGRFTEGSVAPGGFFTFAVDVPPGEPELRVTLAWDDPAGNPAVLPVLVNDLDLRVIAPGGAVHHPWTLDPANPSLAAVRTVRDNRNNLEQVVVTAPAPGQYVVEIEGYDVAQGPEQPFSVVASPNLVLCEDAPTFEGLQLAEPGGSCAEVDLSWTAGESNCPGGRLTYNVYRDTQPGFAPTSQNRIASAYATTSLTDTALAPGLTYHYVVRAVDSSSGEATNGVELAVSAPLAPDLAAPVFAGLASATPGVDCGQVALDWSAAVETCSTPVRYEVHRSTSPGFSPGPSTLVAATFSTSFVDTSVTPGTVHAYVVRAVDTEGNAESNVHEVSVTPTDLNVEVFATPFEASDEGWTIGTPNDASTGTWEWGDPEGTSYQSDNDATENGVNAWITGLSPNPSNGDIDGGTTTLVSASYDMSGTTAPSVAYSRWFTNDRGGSPGDPTDLLQVDVSNDGGSSWTPLEQVGAGTPLAWVPVEFPLPIAATADVRFRFTASDLGSGSLVEAGIDEFELFDDVPACLTCGAPAPSTLCRIDVALQGDDIVVDWSTNPVPTRAVIYHTGASCDPADWIKLGSSDGDSFVHEAAALSDDSFYYRVTFVDDCGREVGFCGTTRCEPPDGGGR